MESDQSMSEPPNHESKTEYNAFLPQKEIGWKTSQNKRETWGNRLEFILANIGYTVGVGTLWRFPMLFVRNGGGAFLVPFTIVLVLMGGPLYHLEVNLGQFTGSGPLKAFEFCPLLKGTGFLMISTCFVLLWYYMTIMAWILYYLYSSLSYKLPWSSCNNSWNTESCQDGNIFRNHSSYDNVTMDTNRTNSVVVPTTPSLEFWLHNVLGKSNGLDEVGHVQPHLAICLLIAWILTTLCIIKGVKSLGKVVYVTALFPYVLLTVLMIRAITLEGAIDGIIYCFHFNTEKLAEPQVWLDGTIQAFYSLGPIWGTIIVMASHNKFKQPTLRDTVTVCVVDTVSTLYAALLWFSILGFMAKKEESSLMNWLQQVFTLVEAVKTGLFDFLPARVKRYPTLVTLGFGACMFPLGLIFTTNCGIYLFQLFDWYATGFALLFGAFFEVTSLTLVYGVDRFSQDIMLMGGNQISKVARFLYCVFIPITTFVTFVIMLAQYGEPNYGDGYKYKRYAIALGISIGLVPVSVFFVVAVWTLLSKSGTFPQKFKKSLEPSNKWLPQDQNAADVYMDKPYNYESTVMQRFKRNLIGSEDTPLF